MTKSADIYQMCVDYQKIVARPKNSNYKIYIRYNVYFHNKKPF